MKRKSPNLGLLRLIWGLPVGLYFAGICLLADVNTTQSQARLPITLFSDNFTTSEYYTNNTQLKYRLTGKKATPVGSERYLVTQLRLEMFEETGQRQMTIEAPECLYDFKARAASSSGPLKIVLGEGRMSVSGEGFLWQQTDSSLIISNRARTLVRGLPYKKSKP